MVSLRAVQIVSLAISLPISVSFKSLSILPLLLLVQAEFGAVSIRTVHMEFLFRHKSTHINGIVRTESLPGCVYMYVWLPIFLL